jgi:hypothetical protein
VTDGGYNPPLTMGTLISIDRRLDLLFAGHCTP